MRATSRAFVALCCGVFVGVAACPARAAVVCLPNGVPVAAQKLAASDQALKSVSVYIDGSYSMIGYIQAASLNLRPHGDLLSVVDSFAGSRAATVDYFRFGEKIAPITGGRDGALAFARSATYSCKGCDNQQSRIDEVLQRVGRAEPGRLSVIVTDLWLSSTALVGSPQVALGSPLTAILTDRKAIGIMGVRAPYVGKIYEMPGGGTYSGARERPLFILAIGSESDVTNFYTSLKQSGSPSFSQERMRFSLFSTGSSNPWRGASGTELSASGAGAMQGAAIPGLVVGGLQQFRFQPQRGGRISGEIDAVRSVPPGAVWSGPLTGTTQVWLLRDPRGVRTDAKTCKSDVWASFAPLRGAWTAVRGKPTAARLTLSAQSGGGLALDKTYLVAAYLSVKTLETPNPADRWMRDWSFSADQQDAVVRGKPSFFKVLNLADLTSILEASVARAMQTAGRARAATAFVVKVER